MEPVSTFRLPEDWPIVLRSQVDGDSGDRFHHTDYIEQMSTIQLTGINCLNFSFIFLGFNK